MWSNWYQRPWAWYRGAIWLDTPRQNYVTIVTIANETPTPRQNYVTMESIVRLVFRVKRVPPSNSLSIYYRTAFFLKKTQFDRANYAIKSIINTALCVMRYHKSRLFIIQLGLRPRWITNKLDLWYLITHKTSLMMLFISTDMLLDMSPGGCVLLAALRLVLSARVT